MLVLDETLVMAYADGELDRDTALEIEIAARDDPNLRQRIAIYLNTRSLLHAAYNQPLHQPAPLQAHLVADSLVNAGPGIDNVAQLRPRRRVEPVIGWAIAAAIAAFVVGFGSGQSWEFSTGQQLAETSRDEAAFRQTVGLALEALPNGQSAPWLTPSGRHVTVTPVRTYVNDGGQYCREYVLARSSGEATDERVLAACRMQAGEWLPTAKSQIGAGA